MEIEQTLDIKSDTLFDRVLIYIMVFLFTMTIVLVSSQLVFRWLPFQVWISQHTQALAKYSLIVGTHFGAAVAARNSEHISMYFLLERLEGIAPRIHSVISFFASAVVTLFLVVAAYAAATSTIRNWGSEFGSSGVVTMGQLLGLILVGLVCYLLYSLLSVRESLVTVRHRLVDGNVPRPDGVESTVEESTE